MEIPYTLCFCCFEQQVVMLQRAFPPNAGLWNGLGGKIEAGETPMASVVREVQEEAAIDLRAASELVFAGISTWGPSGQEPVKGMYVFLASLSVQQVVCIQDHQTPEGWLAWKPLAWLCDPSNTAVVSNIPRFLPPMLDAQAPREYFYEYTANHQPVASFKRLIIRDLPAQVILSDCQGW